MQSVNNCSCKVSVVIVNWNACELLRDCLASIFNETCGLEIEVIVVDNASNDKSVEMVRREFPQAQLVAEDRNLGFASANNVGIARSRGRCILLLNPDTIILDNAIGRSLRWLDTQPDVGVMGCQVLEDENTIQRTCFANPSPLNLFLDGAGITSRFPGSALLGRSNLGGWDRRSHRDVPVVSGMFMLIPRKALDEVGVMDEQFFVYSEEADLCRRFWNAGWRCVFAPVARIIHRDGGGKSTNQTSVKMYVQLQKSSLLYIYKYYGIAGWLVAKFNYIASMLVRVIAHGALSLLPAAINSRHRLQQSVKALRFHLLNN